MLNLETVAGPWERDPAHDLNQTAGGQTYSRFANAGGQRYRQTLQGCWHRGNTWLFAAGEEAFAPLQEVVDRTSWYPASAGQGGLR